MARVSRRIRLFMAGVAARALEEGGESIEPPVNTVLPVISGLAIENETLSTTTGTWTGDGIVYTYQWLDDGVEIPGATSSTYRLTVAEIGAVISVRVTATNSFGPVDATSAGTSAVTAMVDAARVSTVQAEVIFHYQGAARVTVVQAEATLETSGVTRVSTVHAEIIQTIA